jgi:hypothetical protein
MPEASSGIGGLTATFAGFEPVAVKSTDPVGTVGLTGVTPAVNCTGCPAETDATEDAKLTEVGAGLTT